MSRRRVGVRCHGFRHADTIHSILATSSRRTRLLREGEALPSIDYRHSGGVNVQRVSSRRSRYLAQNPFLGFALAVLS